MIAHVPRLAVRLLGLRLAPPPRRGASRHGADPGIDRRVRRCSGAREGRHDGRCGRARRPVAVGFPCWSSAGAATVLRRLALLSLDLGSPRPPRKAGIPLEFGFLEPAEAEAHQAARDGSGEVARERLRRGARCFAARTADGRIASVRWIACGDAHIDFLACTLPLEAGEAYNFDTWTDPAFRGLGVASASGARLNDALAAEGVRTVIRAVWPANDQGLRNAVREGFVPAGTIVSVGRPSAPAHRARNR